MSLGSDEMNTVYSKRPTGPHVAYFPTPQRRILKHLAIQRAGSTQPQYFRP